MNLVAPAWWPVGALILAAHRHLCPYRAHARPCLCLETDKLPGRLGASMRARARLLASLSMRRNPRGRW